MLRPSRLFIARTERITSRLSMSTGYNYEALPVNNICELLKNKDKQKLPQLLFLLLLTGLPGPGPLISSDSLKFRHPSYQQSEPRRRKASTIYYHRSSPGPSIKPEQYHARWNSLGNANRGVAIPMRMFRRVSQLFIAFIS